MCLWKIQQAEEDILNWSNLRSSTSCRLYNLAVLLVSNNNDQPFWVWLVGSVPTKQSMLSTPCCDLPVGYLCVVIYVKWIVYLLLALIRRMLIRHQTLLNFPWEPQCIMLKDTLTGKHTFLLIHSNPLLDFVSRKYKTRDHMYTVKKKSKKERPCTFALAYWQQSCLVINIWN